MLNSQANLGSLSLQTAGALCALVGVLLYLNTLDTGFCFDDHRAIEENHDLRPDTPLSQLIWNDFWGTPMHVKGSHKSYRPLCVATFRLNYLIHELQPMGYHLVNVLLHSAVCYLYVQLCGLVFREVWPALIAGLLFAVHPIHTEAVVGVVGRAEMLSSVFFLLTLFCYVKSAHNNITKGLLWLAASLVFCVCGVLSKEQGITVVAVCLAYDVFFAQMINLKSARTALLGVFQQRSRAVWMITRTGALAVFTVMVMVFRIKVIMKGVAPTFHIHDNPAVALETPYRQLHWLYLCFVNSWLLLNPTFLCADWTMGTIPLITSQSDPRNMATVATFTIIAALSLYGILGGSRTQKVVVFALSLVVFPYIPASNLFFPVGFVIAERILYLPSMGFCMLVALGAWKLLQKYKKMSTLWLIFLLLSHTVKTVLRNRDWLSDMTLYTSGALINPGNGKLVSNLGNQYKDMGDFLLAEEMYRLGMEIQSDNILAIHNLGVLLVDQARYEEAEQVYRAGVEAIQQTKMARTDTNVYYHLAELLKRDPSTWQEAHYFYQKAIKLQPSFLEAYINIGSLLIQMNQTLEAREAFQRAVGLNPHSVEAQYNLALAQERLGVITAAIDGYRKALSINSNHQTSKISLGYLLWLSDGNLQEAEELFLSALSEDANNFKATVQLGLVYQDLGELQKAEQMLLRASQLDPTSQVSLYRLGALYMDQHDYTKAEPRLAKLAQLYPDHFRGLKLLGDCYLGLHQLQKAKEIYETLLLSQHSIAGLTSLAEVYSNLAEVYKELKDFSNAEKHYREALFLDSSHMLTKFRLAYLIVITGNKQKYEEAEELLLEVIAVQPDNENANFCLGILYYSLSDMNKAEEMFRRSLQINPSNPSVLFNLGFVLATLERCSEAIEPLTQLYKLHPHHVNGATQLGVCYMKTGENEKARSIFESVLRTDPTQKNALNNLGLLLIQQNELDRATEIFSQIVEMDPTNEKAAEQLAELHKHQNS